MSGYCSLAERHGLWTKLNIQCPELVADFFIVFARFEYALKRSGYLKSQNAKAEPDWERFAREHASGFGPEDSDVRRAVKYLQANPPKKQWVEDGKVIFSGDHLYGEGKDNDLEELLDIVKGVRNNLFHEGKFPSGQVREPGRNTRLLKDALCVLEHVLELNKEVKRFFDGR